jgi:heme/copper-type cytochrome/quinol oxidase subunit 1
MHGLGMTMHKLPLFVWFVLVTTFYHTQNKEFDLGSVGN